MFFSPPEIVFFTGLYMNVFNKSHQTNLLGRVSGDLRHDCLSALKLWLTPQATRKMAHGLHCCPLRSHGFCELSLSSPRPLPFIGLFIYLFIFNFRIRSQFCVLIKTVFNFNFNAEFMEISL